MATEEQTFKWIAENWPSISAAAVFSLVYLRLHKLYVRLESAEREAHAAMKLAKKLVKTHLKRHGEDVDKLINGEGDE